MPGTTVLSFVVDFPTLGYIGEAWIKQHCRVPDQMKRGEPFELADWQFWILANRCRVRPDAVFVPPELIGPDSPPIGNQAFFYRMTLTIAPQKTGKGPMTAAFTAFEACGPSQFAGWATGGELYLCEDNGCSCGWGYQYAPGEPMGMRHPSPLIQITGFSADSTDNIFRHLRAMIQLGPLKHLLLDRKEFVRIAGMSDMDDLDRIDAVSSSANSRLGNPISDAEQDEVGLWTVANKMIKLAHAQRRGATGMGGRTHCTTNAYDPAENSYAQQLVEAAEDDVFIFYQNPDEVLKTKDGHLLDYSNYHDRKRIHEFVYAGSWWVNLGGVEADARSIAKTDPAQAERFFGNRRVQGKGSYLTDDIIVGARAKKGTKPAKDICLGFDGSASNDWTALRAEDINGLRFTPMYLVGGQERPCVWNPANWPNNRIPRGEVDAAIRQLFTDGRYHVERAYFDPREFETKIEDWAVEFGDEHVIKWYTTKIGPMHSALVRYRTDMEQRDTLHLVDTDYETHVMNARMLAKPGDKFILGKPSDHQKIDLAMCDVLAHEAAADARAAVWQPHDDSVFTNGGVLVFRR